MKLNEKYFVLINNLVLDFDYSNNIVSKFVNFSEYRKESLEHVYKELLNALTGRLICLRNTNKDNKICGKFYLDDCDCDTIYCKLSNKNNLGNKGEQLYANLPVFDVIDSKHKSILEDLGFNINPVTFNDIYDKMYILFDNICKSMNLETPLITRI